MRHKKRVPNVSDFRWSGTNFSDAQHDSVTRTEPEAWIAEMKLHEELFTQLAHNLPAELPATKAKIEARLAA